MKITIEQEKISNNKTDSFFYDGEIAYGTSKSGKKFTLIATGYITITIDQDKYTDNDIQDAIEKYKLTDNKLNKLHDEGRLEWIENNWFEVVWETEAGTTDCDIGNVVYNYDEAIQLLKDYIEEEDKDVQQIIEG